MTGCWRTRNRQPACRNFPLPCSESPFQTLPLPGPGWKSSYKLFLEALFICCWYFPTYLVKWQTCSKKKSVFDCKALDHFPLAWDGMPPMSIKETKPEFVERELLWQHPRIARKEIVERWTVLDMGGEQRLRLHLCAYHLHLHLVVDTVDKGGKQLSV